MSIKQVKTQRTITENVVNDHIEIWAEGFLIDRKVRGLSPHTIGFYRDKLKVFLHFCDSQVITRFDELTPTVLREYLLWLGAKGHTPGGVHACYRALRAFLHWWEDENEPEGWRNPIRKVKAPKVNIKPLEPIDIKTVKQMVETCKRSTFLGARDYALLLFLLDTGVRSSELLALNIEDVDLISGSVFVRKGKGGKPRTVFMGKRARLALRRYVRKLDKDVLPLWCTQKGNRLSYWGLRRVMQKRADIAQVPIPSAHDFRRAFALECLRDGMSIYHLQELMGHADIQVLRRYIRLVNDDLRTAHRQHSPADMLNFK